MVPQSVVRCQNISQPISVSVHPWWLREQGHTAGWGKIWLNSEHCSCCCCFVFSSTLIVYKSPFKLCHCPQQHAYLITGRASCIKLALGQKHTARFKRDWTVLKDKVLDVLNKYSEVISKIWQKGNESTWRTHARLPQPKGSPVCLSVGLFACKLAGYLNDC